MSNKSAYLVMVEPGNNNNKYYRMIQEDINNFRVEYGRVGTTGFQTMSYSMYQWDKKYHEKLRKGYVDQTHLVAVETQQTKDNQYADIEHPAIAQIVMQLQMMAKQAIERNYTISSHKVTQRMIDEAQDTLKLLSNITSLKYQNTQIDVDYFNEQLVKLFRTIPRKMGKVADHIAHSGSDFAEILQREQDLLDVMRGQVVQQQIVGDDVAVTSQQQQTILDALGLQFFLTNVEQDGNIKKHLGEISDKFSKAWAVVNNKTQKQFDQFVASNHIKDIKMLWHGSRNENWWSIINSGLVLRPNAITTGKMFGYGIYFAPKAKKSFGYTSYSGSYWARGSAITAYMSVFDVAYGKPYNVYSHDYNVGSMTYDKLQQVSPNSHCLHAHAGNMLYNDEIVVYKEEQITIKYLVELK